MKTNKILTLLLGLSLACIAVLLVKLTIQNEPNTTSSQSEPTAASNQSEQNLSKYRALYARPVSEWDKPKLDESVVKEWREFEPFKEPPFPANNAYSDIKAFLGLRLFNDPRLSKSGQISCQNCHNQELAFTDGLKLSYGHDRQRGRRNAPNIQMAAFFDELFWDGRAKSLEEQALGPITDPKEMANSLENAKNAIKNATEYYPLFVAAFGDESEQGLWKRHFPQLFEQNATKRLRSFLRDEIKIDKNLVAKFPSQELESARKLININNIAKAIATYERSFVVPKNSRFNAFLNGDYRFLSDKELWGLDIFRNKGECMNCHYGAMLSDNKYHNIGLSFYGRKLQDFGRYEVTKNPADAGKFKTPSLVSVSRSAPYMHGGLFPHLIGVINMYNAGFPVAVEKGTENDPLLPKTDPLIKKLNLTRDEILALEAFLKSL